MTESARQDQGVVCAGEDLGEEGGADPLTREKVGPDDLSHARAGRVTRATPWGSRGEIQALKH